MNPYTQELQTTAKALMAGGKGILAMENNGTEDRRLAKLGIVATAENCRNYRELTLTAPHLDTYINGAILVDETIRQSTSTGESFVSVMERVGIIPGIQADIATQSAEDLTGLAERVREYYQLGARFAKCRAVINIGEDIPSTACIEATAQALARFAAICQAHGLVPIVEPFISSDGDATLDRSQQVTAATLREVFKQLSTEGVAFDRTIFHPSWVTTGASAALPAPVNEIVMATMETLMREVPPTVAGIVLSGGETKEEASAYRNAIDVLFRQAPWVVTFFDARTIDESALEQWHGDSANLSAAQKILDCRATGDNVIYIANRDRQLAVI
jgi:fructose-bisphosphate aldolase, class I